MLTRTCAAGAGLLGATLPLITGLGVAGAVTPAPVSAAPAKAAYLSAVASYNAKVRAEAAAKSRYLAALRTPSPADNAPALRAWTAARAATAAAKAATVAKLAAWRVAKTKVVGVFAGNAYGTNPYGRTSVTITVTKGRITAVGYPLYPKENSDSKIINEWALPQLGAEVITAQSASVALVSGASLTYPDFKASLTSALTKAGLA